MTARRHSASGAAVCLLALAMLSVPACSEEPEPLPIITTKTGVRMVRIPGGWFEMGSDAGPTNETPPHRVWVDAFQMDLCEVTQGQFERLQLSDPSHFKGPQRPVEHMRISEAIEYCNERSDAEGFQRCYGPFDEASKTWPCNFNANGYRLPTEAEWEYACRAGTTGKRHLDTDDERDLDRSAWYAPNAGKQTHPVGRKRPNPWGLYDMYGNVAEWCHDWYDPKYYAASPDSNPRGPGAGKLMVLRGGGWDAKSDRCRSAWRAGENPRLQDACFAKDTTGFRCVRKAPD